MVSLCASFMHSLGSRIIGTLLAAVTLIYSALLTIQTGFEYLDIYFIHIVT